MEEVGSVVTCACDGVRRPSPNRRGGFEAGLGGEGRCEGEGEAKRGKGGSGEGGQAAVGKGRSRIG